MIDDFISDGLLARTIKGFSPRESQQQMADKISVAINESSSVVIEAGTGTGKTFAYLVPALRSDKKVIISTGSKNLQDQLYNKDLPIIKQALDYTGKIALLKGRSNYLCLDRYDSYKTAGGDLNKTNKAKLNKLAKWVNQTTDGDTSKCTSIPEYDAIWPLLTSTNESCTGSDCAKYDSCYVVKARRRALNSDVVVVNHHLFLADVMVKDTGFGELIPKADVFIFDEAHQLPDLACEYFGESLTSHQLIELSKEIILCYRTEVKDVVQLQKCAEKLQKSTQDLRIVIMSNLNSKGNLRDLLNDRKVTNEISSLKSALDFCKEVLETTQGRSTTLDQCFRMLRDYDNLLDRLLNTSVVGFSYWYECIGNNFNLSITPLSVADKFSTLMAERKGTWVFTSATLAVNGKMDYFTRRLGLQDNESLILESPFNYQEQTLFCLPRYVPDSNDPNTAEKLVKMLLPVIEANKGRCFFLCTSYAMMNALASLFRDRTELPVLVQGETSKTQLLEQFIEHGNALLVATNSFWEGVDVQGDILSCVIIDKLPFTSPGDPLMKARIEDCKLQGKDPFGSIQIPEAVIALKQGVGRLIRHDTDRGVIIICDNRLVTRYYGSIFIKSLPPSPRTRDINKVINFLCCDKS